MPHLTFFFVAAAVSKAVLPAAFARWLTTSDAVRAAVSSWYPLLSTLWYLHDCSSSSSSSAEAAALTASAADREDGDDGTTATTADERDDDRQKENRQRVRRQEQRQQQSTASENDDNQKKKDGKTMPQRRRRRQLEVVLQEEEEVRRRQQQNQQQQQLRHWLDYWIAYGTYRQILLPALASSPLFSWWLLSAAAENDDFLVAAAAAGGRTGGRRRRLARFAAAKLKPALLQLEFVFLVWMVALPYFCSAGDGTATTANTAEANAAADDDRRLRDSTTAARNARRRRTAATGAVGERQQRPQPNQQQPSDSSMWPSSPLHYASRYLCRAAYYVQHHAAAIFSQEAWQTVVVTPASSFLGVAVACSLVKGETKTRIEHFLGEFQTVVLPGIFTLVPVLGTSLSIPYARTVLPVAKSTPIAEAAPADSNNRDDANNNARLVEQQQRQEQQRLITSCQYWVLNTVLVMCTRTESAASLYWFLSWLPFFRSAVFVFWWYLSWPCTTRWLYASFVEEAELLVVYAIRWFDGDVDGGGVTTPRAAGDDDAAATLKSPKLVQAVEWVVRKLPSAHDLERRDVADAVGGNDNDADVDDDDAEPHQQQEPERERTNPPSVRAAAKVY